MYKKGNYGNSYLDYFTDWLDPDVTVLKVCRKTQIDLLCGCLHCIFADSTNQQKCDQWRLQCVLELTFTGNADYGFVMGVH
jgi:hypothetical protein